MENKDNSPQEVEKPVNIPRPPEPMDSREWVDQMLEDLYGI